MRSKLTYANVTATLALFLALGGSSYAVVQFTGRNVKDGSLTTRDVKNRSLLARDFRRGQLKAGPKGDRGERGDQGLQGVQGEPGSAAAYAVVKNDGTLIESKNIDRITRGGFGAPDTSGGGLSLAPSAAPHLKGRGASAWRAERPRRDRGARRTRLARAARALR